MIFFECIYLIIKLESIPKKGRKEELPYNVLIAVFCLFYSFPCRPLFQGTLVGTVNRRDSRGRGFLERDWGGPAGGANH